MFDKFQFELYMIYLQGEKVCICGLAEVVNPPKKLRSPQIHKSTKKQILLYGERIDLLFEPFVVIEISTYKACNQRKLSISTLCV